MNPSTQEFVKLLDAIPIDKAIVLPNNSNVVMAAQQAAEISRKHVVVVPSKTIPQGIAAMLVFNDQRSLEANVQTMEAATHHVLTGEITRAGGSLIFLRGQLRAGERTVFTFSGTIKRVKRKTPADAIVDSR